MPREPRFVFLLVRSQAELKLASEELLSILQRWSPGGAPEVIRGIWIDVEGVANLPSALVLPDEHGVKRIVRILETTGINGIWMLCWLEAAARTVSRVDLVEGLLKCLGYEETEISRLTARFIPGFTDDTAESSTREESRVLEFCYPGLVLPPGYLCGDGTLRLPLVQPHVAGTTT